MPTKRKHICKIYCIPYPPPMSKDLLMSPVSNLIITRFEFKVGTGIKFIKKKKKDLKKLKILAS